MTASSITAHSRGRSSRARNFLPGQADFKQALDLIRVQLYRPVPECLPRVVRGLQQAGHDHGLKVADRGGAGFQADVDLVRVRQHVAERVPPPGLAGLPGQLDQPVPFGSGHAVQLEKGPNVPGLGAAPPGLDAEQGRSRPLQLPRHLLLLTRWLREGSTWRTNRRNEVMSRM